MALPASPRALPRWRQSSSFWGRCILCPGVQSSGPSTVFSGVRVRACVVCGLLTLGPSPNQQHRGTTAVLRRYMPQRDGMRTSPWYHPGTVAVGASTSPSPSWTSCCPHRAARTRIINYIQSSGAVLPIYHSSPAWGSRSWVDHACDYTYCTTSTFVTRSGPWSAYIVRYLLDNTLLCGGGGGTAVRCELKKTRSPRAVRSRPSLLYST